MLVFDECDVCLNCGHAICYGDYYVEEQEEFVACQFDSKQRGEHCCIVRGFPPLQFSGDEDKIVLVCSAEELQIVQGE